MDDSSSTGSSDLRTRRSVSIRLRGRKSRRIFSSCWSIPIHRSSEDSLTLFLRALSKGTHYVALKGLHFAPEEISPWVPWWNILRRQTEMKLRTYRETFLRSLSIVDHPFVEIRFILTFGRFIDRQAEEAINQKHFDVSEHSLGQISANLRRLWTTYEKTVPISSPLFVLVCWMIYFWFWTFVKTISPDTSVRKLSLLLWLVSYRWRMSWHCSFSDVNWCLKLHEPVTTCCQSRSIRTEMIRYLEMNLQKERVRVKLLTCIKRGSQSSPLEGTVTDQTIVPLRPGALLSDTCLSFDWWRAVTHSRLFYLLNIDH